MAVDKLRAIERALNVVVANLAGDMDTVRREFNEGDQLELHCGLVGVAGSFGLGMAQKMDPDDPGAAFAAMVDAMLLSVTTQRLESERNTEQ